MENGATATGSALVKRSTWLAAKLSFLVLAPICVTCWAAVAALIMYRSGRQGTSPFRLISEMDPTQFAKITDGLIAAVELVIVGVVFCAVAGAAIGAITAGLRARQYRVGSRP